MTRYRWTFSSTILSASVCIAAWPNSGLSQSPTGGLQSPPAQAAAGPRTELTSEQLTQLNKIVEQLSSSEFDLREQATESLLQLDSAFLKQLKRARDASNDPEVRVRLSGVIARLKFKWIEETARVFLRDPDMNQTHELDGWRSFAKTAGATRKSKRLFIRLFEAYPNLVETELVDEKQAFELALTIANGIEIREQNLEPADPEDGLALLYCANLAGRLMDAGLVNKTLRVLPRAEFRTLISEPQSRKPIELMIRDWALRTGDRRPMAMILMMEVDFSDVRQVALEFLDTPAAKDDSNSVLTAMEALYRYGRPEDLPRITPWLEDKSVCYEDIRTRLPDTGSGGPPPGYPTDRETPVQPPRNSFGVGGSEEYSLEVRDAALLACVKISSADPRDYFPTLITHPLRGFSARSITLPKEGMDDFRKARIDRWRKLQK